MRTYPVKGYVNEELKQKVRDYCNEYSISESAFIALVVRWFLLEEE